MTPIRAYTPADHRACLALYDGNTPRFFDPTERPAFVHWLTALDEGRLRYPAQNHAEHHFVLEHNGKVQGCGGFYVARAEALAHLTWGMIAAAHHRQGLGRQLLQHRLHLLGTHYRDCAVVLDTTQHSAPFFAKMGFVTTAITPDSYGPGLDRYDMRRS